MKMLLVSQELTETIQSFQDHDHSPQLCWSGCNWSAGHGKSYEVTWGHNPLFANDSRQDGDIVAQMVPSDFARQSASNDMHIGLLGT